MQRTEQDDIELIRDRALFVREETVRLISIAKTGHYASAFSCAEIFAALYYGVMRLRRGEPNWPDRDRFLLGKGHAAVGQYPILADYEFFSKEFLDGYTRLGNPLGDHPDMRNVPGIDFSSGSIAHALSAGLGMALGGRIQGRDFNVFVLLGDGDSTRARSGKRPSPPRITRPPASSPSSTATSSASTVGWTT
jgi:transketolase